MSFTLQFNAWNSYCSLAIGTFLNGFLLKLSRKECSTELKEYRNVIVYFSLWNIASLILQALNQPLLFFSTNSLTYIFAQGIVASIPSIWLRNAFMTLYCLCFIQTVASLALQFFDRYLTICRSFTNQKVRFSIYSSFSAFFGFSVIFIELFSKPSADVQPNEIPELAKMLSILEFNSFKIAMIYDPANPFFFIPILVIILMMAICYFSIIFCFIRIRLFVTKNITDSANVKKKKTINQISLNMILQAFLPSYCLLLALVGIFSLLFGLFNSLLAQLGMLIFPAFNWLPILNPFVTILTISEYRKRVLKLLHIRKDEQSTAVANLSTQPSKLFNRQRSQNQT